MLLEKTFHRKIQSRKIFLFRDSFEKILRKAEDLLSNRHQDYTEAFTKLLTARNHTKLAEYYDMHNSYVQQLHAANGMMEYYHKITLPKLLEELEEVYIDLSDTIASAVLCAADMLANKSREQTNHYDNIAAAANAVNSRTDISNFIKTLNNDKFAQPLQKHIFNPPYMESDPTHIESGMMLRNELVIDRLSEIQLPNQSQTLKQDVSNLEAQIKQLQEAVESMERLQLRSLESSLFNKANELQEEISGKKFDFQVANIHLAAVKAQLDLFASSSHSEHPLEGNHAKERKSSVASTGIIKNKWLKAVNILKTGSSRTNLADKNDSSSDKKQKTTARPLSATPANLESHIFQEHTYKKITACDHCKEILRGHNRQGLKCKLCRMNVHADCQDKAGYCQPKSRLLTRQKSTSELEAAKTVPETTEEETPHSPQRKRLTLRMKSFSLDSPESSEQVHRRHQVGPPAPHNGQSPQSPMHPSGSGRRQLPSLKNVRMSSVELPDENEKYQSSASTSPCPSPKPHRLLPQNLYVVLYNFRSRHNDEIDLKAGSVLTVIDTADPDWWQGKCLGNIGYFPSKYVTKLRPGERPLQVAHAVQVSDGQDAVKLLNEQIVIQITEEEGGMVEIRTGSSDNSYSCPVKYLKDV